MNSQEKLSQEVTAELPNYPTTDHVGETLTPLAVDLAAATHQGHVRETNEDHYLIMRFGRSLQTLGTNLDEGLVQHSFELTGYGMLVADGMGGMAGGEVASSMALRRLVELVLDTPDWIMSLKTEQDAAIVLKRMSQRFVQIDEALRKRAKDDASLHGMGTTLTVAATLGSDLVIGHVGDSRAYMLRGNRLSQLTTDHTLAQALIDAGIAKPEDPAPRSMRHVLTAALGSMGNGMQPQVSRLQVRAGDRLLLCTDGLTDMVATSSIATVMHEADSAQKACDHLIDLALAGGGLDNITVILGRFGSP